MVIRGIQNRNPISTSFNFHTRRTFHRAGRKPRPITNVPICITYYYTRDCCCCSARITLYTRCVTFYSLPVDLSRFSRRLGIAASIIITPNIVYIGNEDRSVIYRRRSNARIPYNTMAANTKYRTINVIAVMYIYSMRVRVCRVHMQINICNLETETVIPTAVNLTGWQPPARNPWALRPSASYRLQRHKHRARASLFVTLYITYVRGGKLQTTLEPF